MGIERNAIYVQISLFLNSLNNLNEIGDFSTHIGFEQNSRKSMSVHVLNKTFMKLLSFFFFSSCWFFNLCIHLNTLLIIQKLLQKMIFDLGHLRSSMCVCAHNRRGRNSLGINNFFLKRLIVSQWLRKKLSLWKIIILFISKSFESVCRIKLTKKLFTKEENFLSEEASKGSSLIQ